MKYAKKMSQQQPQLVCVWVWLVVLLGSPFYVAESFVPISNYDNRRTRNLSFLRYMSIAPPERDAADAKKEDAPEISMLDSNNVKAIRSKRARILNKLGFKRLSRDQGEIRKAESKRKPTTKKYIFTPEKLDEYFLDRDKEFRDAKGEIDFDLLLNALQAEGRTQQIGSLEDLEYVHPVAKLLHERRKSNSLPSEGPRPDGFRVALAIEGGGMRGCVSAGMAAALHYLNLADCFDVVYGSSAGSIVGSYFVTRQLPFFGPEVYYDRLTTAGRQFIDTRRLLRSLGFGLLDPRLLKDVFTRPEEGKPVLNLSFLLKRTLMTTKPLDWEKFVQMQKKQPLKVIASGLKSEKAIVMDMENGSFESLHELTDCQHASCLLPGIAGPLMNLNRTAIATKTGQKLVQGNNLQGDDLEPMADSLLFQPLPFHAALDEGATHVVTIRSRPDGVDISGKGSVFERLIYRRFLLRKNRLPNIFKFMSAHGHKKVYARDVLKLNQFANSTRDYKDTSEPHILTLALPPGSDEVTKLETGRKEIFEGLRRGFARVYDALVDDPAERGRGAEVAKKAFPDEILDYNPLDIDVPSQSAFEVYLRENNVVPNAWEDLPNGGWH